MFDRKVYKSIDTKEWIVLIHGFGGSSLTWKKQIDAYGKYYHVLALEMHASSQEKNKDSLSLDHIFMEINHALDVEKIIDAHFISLSFGSLISLAYASRYPHRVKSLIMAGGILSFGFSTNILLFLARVLKYIVPYMMLYNFFAFIIMPKSNHKKSRSIFVREALKLGHNEFCNWIDIIPKLNKTKHTIDIVNQAKKTLPILYVMGSEDHLFLPRTLKFYNRLDNAKISIISGCGHVCNLENYKVFNEITLNFLNAHHEYN